LKSIKEKIKGKKVTKQQGCGNDNVVVDAFKLILLNYSNFSIAKIVVKKIKRVKSTLSCVPMNT